MNWDHVSLELSKFEVSTGADVEIVCSGQPARVRLELLGCQIAELAGPREGIVGWLHGFIAGARFARRPIGASLDVMRTADAVDQ